MEIPNNERAKVLVQALPYPRKVPARWWRTDSIVLCSLFGALPLTTFAHQRGNSHPDEGGKRLAVLIGAVLLLLVSLFPKAANVLEDLPRVLGGQWWACSAPLPQWAKNGHQVGFSKRTWILSLSCATAAA